MIRETSPVQRTAWDHIPPNTECERDGCQLPAVNVHHTLRPSFTEKVIDTNGVAITKRNQRHLLQHLCEKHHHGEGHNLFSETGKWPVGYGTEEAPFKRNCPQVEALIANKLRLLEEAQAGQTIIRILENGRCESHPRS